MRCAFIRQRLRMNVFAELVRDTDRNKGNVVYTSDWRVVMLDFSRAFRLETPLRHAGHAGDVRPGAADGDAGADAGRRRRRRSTTHLTGDEIKAIMARRDLLVAHFDQLIAKRGENVVLY